jgi:hypothetical protein
MYLARVRRLWSIMVNFYFCGAQVHKAVETCCTLRPSVDISTTGARLDPTVNLHVSK